MEIKDDKIYRIIGCPPLFEGLFAMYKHAASNIIKAYEDGEIPVVDLKHYKTYLFKDGREYFDNVWEYFFLQPHGIGLDDLDGKNVKISCRYNTRWADKKYMINPMPDLPRTKEDTRKNPYAEKYAEFLKFNDEMKRYFYNAREKYFGDEKEILGIIMRGSDYLKCKPADHCIPPDIEEVIKKTKELQNELHYKKIYFATEDKDYYERFKKEFGGMLIENTQYKYDRDEVTGHLAALKYPRKDHMYNLQKEYACSMYLLSKCKYLIGSMGNTSLFVYLMSNYFNDYEYVYLWDKGVYPSKKRKFNLVREIFSCRNQGSGNKRHKILTIAGVKMKFEYPENPHGCRGGVILSAHAKTSKKAA